MAMECPLLPKRELEDIHYFNYDYEEERTTHDDLLLYLYAYHRMGMGFWEEVFLIVEVEKLEPLTCRRVGLGHTKGNKGILRLPRVFKDIPSQVVHLV